VQKEAYSFRLRDDFAGTWMKKINVLELFDMLNGFSRIGSERRVFLAATDGIRCLELYSNKEGYRIPFHLFCALKRNIFSKGTDYMVRQKMMWFFVLRWKR